MASVEILDYKVVYNGQAVTCFEVGSVSTVGYASLKDAMQNTNKVVLPDMVFKAVEDILDHGIIPATVWVAFDSTTGHGWCDWEEEPEPLTVKDVLAINDEESVRKLTISAKQRRSARRKQNARHKQEDRQHGKRRADSAKNLRRWEDDCAQMERAQVMWHENNKGEYVPRPVDRKFHERRFTPSPDWTGEPFRMSLPERTEAEMIAEELRSQQEVLDWDMQDTLDALHGSKKTLTQLRII